MIRATRDNWLLQLEALRADLNSQEVVKIYPLDGLTREMVADAMKAQGMTTTFDRYGAVLKWGKVEGSIHPSQPIEFKPDWWIIHVHGNTIGIRRANY